MAEDTRALLRTYVALTLAHEAALQCVGAGVLPPCFAVVLNSQGLALSELSGLLERAFAGEGGPPTSCGTEEDCAALLM